MSCLQWKQNTMQIKTQFHQEKGTYYGIAKKVINEFAKCIKEKDAGKYLTIVEHNYSNKS